MDKDGKHLLHLIESGNIREAEELALTILYSNKYYVKVNDLIVKTAIEGGHYFLAETLVENGYKMPTCMITLSLFKGNFDILENLI